MANSHILHYRNTLNINNLVNAYWFFFFNVELQLKKFLKEMEPEGEREREGEGEIDYQLVFVLSPIPFIWALPFYMYLSIIVLGSLNLSTQINLSGQRALIPLNKTISLQVCIWPKWVSPKSFFKDVRELWERKYLASSLIVSTKTSCHLVLRCVLYTRLILTFQIYSVILSAWCFCVPLGRSPDTNHILIATQEWFCFLLMASWTPLRNRRGESGIA